MGPVNGRASDTFAYGMAGAGCWHTSMRGRNAMALFLSGWNLIICAAIDGAAIPIISKLLLTRKTVDEAASRSSQWRKRPKCVGCAAMARLGTPKLAVDTGLANRPHGRRLTGKHWA